jgi:hypothetical protein
MPWWEIGESIIRGSTTLAATVYILSAIDDRNTGVILATLGIVYADIMAEIARAAVAKDTDSPEKVIKTAITVLFLVAMFLVCIVYIFVQLPRPSWMSW